MARDIGQVVPILNRSEELAVEAAIEAGVGEGVGYRNRGRQALGDRGRGRGGELDAARRNRAAVELIADVAHPATDRNGTATQQVGIVVPEADHLGTERRVRVAEARFVIPAFLRAGIGAARPRRRETARDARQQQQIADFVSGAKRGQPFIDIFGTHARRTGRTGGIAARIIEAGEVDPFITDARRQRQRADLDPVLDVESQRVRLRLAIGLHARGGLGHEVQRAAGLGVELVVLQAVFLVLMIADGEIEHMAQLAGLEGPRKGDLHALAVVGAVVVAHAHRARRAVRTAQDGERSRISGGIVEHRIDRIEAAIAVEIDILQLGPVALEIVPVSGYRQQRIVHEGQRAGEAILVLLAQKVVPLAGGVAAIGIGGKVIVRQSQIGLVRVQLAITIGEFQPAIDRRTRCRMQRHLAAIILALEAGIGIGEEVDGLEAVAAQLIGLDERADIVGVDPGIDMSGIIIARSILPHGARGNAVFGDRGGAQVDRTADGARAVAHGRRALDHLDRFHPSDGGEIISGGRGIGRGRDQHAVFHQRNIAGAFHGRAAKADIGKQPEAVLFLQVHAGHLPQHAVGIGIVEQAQFLGIDQRRRARNRTRIDAAFHRNDGIDGIHQSLLLGLRRGWRRRFRSFGGRRKGREQGDGHRHRRGRDTQHGHPPTKHAAGRGSHRSDGERP